MFKPYNILLTHINNEHIMTNTRKQTRFEFNYAFITTKNNALTINYN